MRARRRSVAALERLQRAGRDRRRSRLVDPERRRSCSCTTSRPRPGGTCRATTAARACAARARVLSRARSVGALSSRTRQLVAAALHEHFGLAPRARDRSLSRLRRAALLAATGGASCALPRARSLGVDARAPLVGFVTSGDFAKRGLDLFLDCAARIAAARPDARFLVVGSKRLPAEARAHALVRDGRRALSPEEPSIPSAGSRRSTCSSIRRASRSSEWCLPRRKRWVCPC